MFTMRTVDACELVTFGVPTLLNLQTQFPEIYADIFKDQQWKLWIMKQTKKEAQRICREKIDTKSYTLSLNKPRKTLVFKKRPSVTQKNEAESDMMSVKSDASNLKLF
mmetsp:Transcript_20581/g.25270  ORF Transcript_20581/g.25270 Transcript_20581/m.25270 type:complete len:108 (-) Transcript_20581:53-376(-)